MRKLIFLTLLASLVAGSPSIAAAGKFSIGGFVGLNIPVGQQDVGNGTLFGAKGRIVLLPFLGIEPNFVFSEYGDKEHDVDGVTMTRKGGEMTSFGADAVVGTLSGFSQARFYGLVGVNSNTTKREGLADQTGLGVAFGAGIEFLPSNMFSLEVRARIHGIRLEGGGARNNLELSAGLNYYFGPK
ncbi:MAG: outer membrane beta-barrel protein [candidate division Zixibacteria bacterium]|nr:outer membrane beta-barrel protein [candidate division Zixibacteria bacterium]